MALVMKPCQSLPWPAGMDSRAEPDAECPAADVLRLPASQASLKRARRYVEETATAFGFDSDGCYELVFAVNEAVTNAIKHGRADVGIYLPERGRKCRSFDVRGPRLRNVCRTVAGRELDSRTRQGHHPHGQLHR